MKRYTYSLVIVMAVLSIGFLQSCKNKNPSVLKVFVRSASNELLTDARVVIIADIGNNDSQIEYVDTLLTNASGFVEFNVADYFDQAGGSEVGNFDLLCRKNGKEGTGYARCRVHTTAVETVFLEE